MLRNDARVQQALSRHGFRALIATTAENVRYLTDYESPGLYIYRYHNCYGIAVPHREPVLVTTLAGLEYIIGRPVSTSDIRATGRYFVERRTDAPLDPAEEETQRLRGTCPHYKTSEDALVAVLSEAETGGGSIAVDECGISPAAWRSLEERLGGARLVEGAAIFAEIRRLKSHEELALIRKAIAINESAASAAFARAGTGIPETDMEATFRAETARVGADPVHWETTVGPRSSGSFYAGAYVGRPGDIIRSDSSVRYHMYWSDTGRTRVIGTPSADHARSYDAILAGQLAMLAKVRPGVRVGDIFATAVDTIRQEGIPQFKRHHVGHGIGLEMYEFPILVESSDIRLEAGMVINVEVPYYEAGYVGLQVEDTVLVTETGCEILTSADRSIVSV